MAEGLLLVVLWRIGILAGGMALAFRNLGERRDPPFVRFLLKGSPVFSDEVFEILCQGLSAFAGYNESGPRKGEIRLI